VLVVYETSWILTSTQKVQSSGKTLLSVKPIMPLTNFDV